MKTLVITGGIACGKSTATRALLENAQGALLLFDCDAEASRILNSGVINQQLIAEFGQGSVTEAGIANRDFLRARIYGDEVAKKALENMIHPMLHQECLAQTEFARQNKAIRGIIIDIPLFFETGMRWPHDAVCTVAVSRETQKTRLAIRNGFSAEMIGAMLAAQHPIAEKVAKADFVIWNEGSPQLLHQQVKRLYHHFFHD